MLLHSLHVYVWLHYLIFILVLHAAIGALKGPLHGGANEQVMKMLTEIGSVENVESIYPSKIRK